jgi:hypothetical protein
MYRKRKTLTEIDEKLQKLDRAKLDWRDPTQIGISQKAFDYIAGEGSPLTLVFCHPKVIESNPHLIIYYRSLAGLPQKGATRLAFDVKKFEEGKPIPMGKAVDLARVLNSYISELVDSDPEFSPANAKLMVAMSYGAQMNGSWRNAVGEEGGSRIKQILVAYLREKKVIKDVTYKDGIVVGPDKPVDVDQVQRISLINAYSLTFSSEPDVSLRDTDGTLVSVVEIKSGIDKAGARERYGAAKKSFSSARHENKAVDTMYLGLLTDRVKKDIKDDQLVTKEFEIIDVFANQAARHEFLDRVLWLCHM